LIKPFTELVRQKHN